jgi:hypothetical protein
MLSAAAVLVLGAAEASPAAAASPWWHLTAGTRPTYLSPGAGQSQVQELNTTPGPFGASEFTNFYFTHEGEGHTPERVTSPTNPSGEFASEPGSAEFGLPTPTAAHIQELLEEGLYGAGNVLVTEETLPAGALRFTITGVGKGANQAVPTLGVVPEVGTAKMTLVTKGRPDGEVYFSAINLGNASISGHTDPIELTDVLPPGLEAVAIEGTRPSRAGNFLVRVPIPCKKATLTCTLEPNTFGQNGTSLDALAPFDDIELRVSVDLKPGAHSGELNEVRVSGGEGFSCAEVGALVGSYGDIGCTEEHQGTEAFQRTYTGPVPGASLREPIVVSTAPVPFGVSVYQHENEEEGGGPALQAASHPFQQTTTIVVNQTADTSPPGSGLAEPHVNPAGPTKDIHFQWPPGLIGNPTNIATCTDAQFFTSTYGGGGNLCPANAAIGAVNVLINEPGTVGVGEVTKPLFNLVPRYGEPARFGFNVTEGNAPVVIDTSLRSDGDYGVTVESNNITQTAALLSATVTVWGNPGDPSHNLQRGNSCVLESRGFSIEGIPGVLPCTATATNGGAPPFLSLPTSCTGPSTDTVTGDLWNDQLSPADFPLLFAGTMPALEGCNRVPFSPQIESEPTSKAAASPTGLGLDLNINDEGQVNPQGLVQSQVKKVVVSLPTGVTTNPSVANGLTACTLAQYRAEELGTQTCPESSKVGEVEIQSPLVKPTIHGSVYVAKQHDNPANNLLSIYMVAKNPELGVLVKSAGAVTPNPQTGQLTTTFDELPQLPFSHFHFAFRTGQRAPLITPGLCGRYTTGADLYPYSNPTVPIHRDATFEVSAGANGAPCATAESQLPNKPTLEAGTLTPIAGAYSPFVFKVRRADGSQTLSSISATLPEGLLGKLAGVKECSGAQIAQAEGRGGEGQGALELAQPSCPAASEVGVVNVGTGVGTQPYYVQGKAYLAGPYKGAPLSLAIITPAVVGPFDLGTIVVRTALYVNETTAQITAKSDPIPTIVHGLPTVVQSISLNMNRPDFTLNPTSCEPKQIEGSATSTLGNVAPLRSGFQVGACGALGFKPELKLSLKGATKRAGVPALKAVLTYPKGSYANVKSVSTVLPKSEFIDNAHIGNTCTRVQFNAGSGQGAQCPKNSLLGHAVAYSPLIEKPLEGNVYLRSNGGERELPDLVAALKGQIDVTLVGFIDSVGKKGSETSRIRTRFMNVPDAPVSRFVLQLAGAKKGLLQNSANLCKVSNIAQVKATAQNGRIYDTEPAVTNDCGKKGKKKSGKAGNGGGGK